MCNDNFLVADVLADASEYVHHCFINSPQCSHIFIVALWYCLSCLTNSFRLLKDSPQWHLNSVCIKPSLSLGIFSSFSSPRAFFSFKRVFSKRTIKVWKPKMVNCNLIYRIFSCFDISKSEKTRGPWSTSLTWESYNQ